VRPRVHHAPPPGGDGDPPGPASHVEGRGRAPPAHGRAHRPSDGLPARATACRLGAIGLPARGDRAKVPHVRLIDDDARARLAGADHGVLCTVHPERGVDPIPCVFAVDRGRLAVPVDTVKPKAPGLLQRERNLRADPRAALLVERWDQVDWRPAVRPADRLPGRPRDRLGRDRPVSPASVRRPGMAMASRQCSMASDPWGVGVRPRRRRKPSVRS
jgi:hypothetical protein